MLEQFELQGDDDPRSGKGLFAVTYLSMMYPLTMNQAVVRLLEKHSWIDVTTRSVKVSFPLFNANSDVFVLTTVSFDFDLGGNVKPTRSFRTASMNSGDSTTQALQVLCLLVLVLMTLWELLQVLLAVRRGALIAYFDSAANIIDWAIIVFGMVAVHAKLLADH